MSTTYFVEFVHKDGTRSQRSYKCRQWALNAQFTHQAKGLPATLFPREAARLELADARARIQAAAAQFGLEE